MTAHAQVRRRYASMVVVVKSVYTAAPAAFSQKQAKAQSRRIHG